MGEFIIRQKVGSKYYLKTLAKTLGRLYGHEDYADVTIHCKNSDKVKANKLILLQGSAMLKSVFRSKSDCFDFNNNTFDLVCPDFSAKAMKSVLQILHYGYPNYKTLFLRYQR
jgi:hypothetical protein